MLFCLRYRLYSKMWWWWRWWCWASLASTCSAEVRWSVNEQLRGKVILPVYHQTGGARADRSLESCDGWTSVGAAHVDNLSLISSVSTALWVTRAQATWPPLVPPYSRQRGGVGGAQGEGTGPTEYIEAMIEQLYDIQASFTCCRPARCAVKWLEDGMVTHNRVR